MRGKKKKGKESERGWEKKNRREESGKLLPALSLSQLTVLEKECIEMNEERRGGNEGFTSVSHGQAKSGTTEAV